MNNSTRVIISFNNLRLSHRKELVQLHALYVCEGPQAPSMREFLYVLTDEYVSVVYDSRKECIVSVRMLQYSEVEVFVDSLEIKVSFE